MKVRFHLSANILSYDKTNTILKHHSLSGMGIPVFEVYFMKIMKLFNENLIFLHLVLIIFKRTYIFLHTSNQNFENKRSC